MDINKEIAEALSKFERKLIRRIYDPAKESNAWRIRYIQEIDILLNREDTVIFIKAQKIQWLDHLLIEQIDERMLREIMRTEVYKNRKTGRPRMLKI